MMNLGTLKRACDRPKHTTDEKVNPEVARCGTDRNWNQA